MKKRKSNKNIEKRIAEFLEQAKMASNFLRVPDLDVSENEFTNELINPQKRNRI